MESLRELSWLPRVKLHFWSFPEAGTEVAQAMVNGQPGLGVEWGEGLTEPAGWLITLTRTQGQCNSSLGCSQSTADPAPTWGELRATWATARVTARATARVTAKCCWQALCYGHLLQRHEAPQSAASSQSGCLWKQESAPWKWSRAWWNRGIWGFPVVF